MYACCQHNNTTIASAQLATSAVPRAALIPLLLFCEPALPPGTATVLLACVAELLPPPLLLVLLRSLLLPVALPALPCAPA